MSASNKTENFYLSILKILLFLIPFLPLYVSPSRVFPYITGKNFAFRGLVEIAAVFWVGLIFLQKEYRPSNSIITTSVLFFTFIVGLADLLGINPYNSFWSNYERMEGYITILHLSLYFMIVKTVLRTKKDWIIFLNIFLWISFLVGIFALISAPKSPVITSRFMMEYGTRMYGTIGNPPFLASYLLLSIFLGLILIFNTKKTFLKCTYLLPIGLNSVVIYLTATRSPILAAFVGIIIFAFFFLIRKAGSPQERIFKKITLIFLGAGIIAVVGFLASGDIDAIKHDRTLSRFIAMFSDPSVETRFNTWKMAWEGIKKRPILGWGQENFIAVYTVNPIPFVRTQVWIDRAHNIVIDWLINAGILGLTSYLAVFGATVYVLYKSFQKKILSEFEFATIYISLIVYFIHNLFTFDTINTYLIFFTILSYIDNIKSVKSALSSESEDVSDLNKKNIKLAVAACFAVLIFTVVAYYVNYKPIKVSQFSRHISSSKEYQSFSTIRKDFDRVLSLGTFGDTDVRRMMVDTAMNIITREFFQDEGALEFIKSAAEEAEKSVSLNRYNLEYLTKVINFYVSIASYETSFIAKAETLINKCIRLNPQYEWLYFVLADTYILKKNYEQAFMIVKKMAALNPDNDYKQIKLAFAAILTLREGVVSSTLENVKRIRAAYNNEVAAGEKPVFSVGEFVLFAKTYKQVKNLHKALYYYKEVIASLKINNSPDFFGDSRGFTEKEKLHLEAKFHFEIAKIYHELGEKGNAVNDAKKAASLDPMNYAENVKKFIKSIEKID